MAVEKHIKEGDTCTVNKDYLGALAAFSAALKENPEAFQAYIKRANAYQKLYNYENAKKDISEAFSIAEKRGKRSDIGLCYFRLGLVYYAEKKYTRGLYNFNKASDFDCTEPTVAIWKNKAEYDLKNHPEKEVHSENEDDGLESIPAVSADVKESTEERNKVGEEGEKKTEKIKSDKTKEPTTEDSTSLAYINKHAPLKVKIRDDWYQTNEAVIITIYAKNVKQETLQIKFSDSAVTVAFPSAAGSEYNYHLDPLFAAIDAEKSSYRVYSTKLEVTLAKKELFKWATLEKSGDDTVITKNSTESAEPSGGLVYPSSSKKAVNWANFSVAEDDEEEKSSEDFFAKLYKDTDDDTRRAMMKSYVESNGTVLTTNWKEAAEKTFETSPPEGMEAKKWGK